MEVVNKNVKSKNNTLEYLKNNKSSFNSEHEEKEFEHLIASIVMININDSITKKKNFNVCITCIKKDKNTVLDNIKSKDFDNQEEAINYYNNLKNLIDSIDEEKLYELINENQEEI